MLQYSSLFLAGLFVGLLIYGAPISHLDMMPISDISKMSLPEMFKPSYAYATHLYIYRPLSFLIIKTLYDSFGLNQYAFQLFTSVALGLFGAAVYKFLLMINPKKVKIAYIASLFSMMSPPALVSTWFLTNFEVLGAVFVYISLITFIRLERLRGLDQKTLIIFILFIISSIAALLLKESSRIFLVILLLILAFLFRRKVNHIQSAGLLIILSFAFATLFLFSLKGSSAYRISPFDNIFYFTYHTVFLIFHNLIQVFYSVFIAGIMVLFLSSLMLLSKKKQYLITIAGVAMLVLILFTPVLAMFSFMGMVVFSSESVIAYIFALLLVIALIVRIRKGDKTGRLYSINILTALIAVITITIFIPSVREDVSSTVYVTVVPLLIYLVIESFSDILDTARKNRTSVKNIVLVSILAFSAVSMPYYFFSNAANTSNELKAVLAANYNTTKYLAGINLTDSTVFYTSKTFKTNEVVLESLNAKNMNNTDFIFLSSNKDSDNISDIIDEMCVKIGGDAISQDIYVYDVMERAILKDSVYPVLEGNFNWTENGTFGLLSAAPIDTFYNLGLLKDRGTAVYSQKIRYSKETLLEKFLKRNAVKLHIFNASYSQIYPWLEDLMSRTGNGVPFNINFESIGVIYYLNRSALDCKNIYSKNPDSGESGFYRDNWYYEEKYRSISWRWMSQNATISIFNQKNESNEIRLNLTVWGFYKPRMLEIYLNGGLATVYNVFHPWEFNNFTVSLNLKPGGNIITLRSKEECSIAKEVFFNGDSRCLSFAFVTNP